jgi:hypothetical protein
VPRDNDGEKLAHKERNEREKKSQSQLERRTKKKKYQVSLGASAARGRLLNIETINSQIKINNWCASSFPQSPLSWVNLENGKVTRGLKIKFSL